MAGEQNPSQVYQVTLPHEQADVVNKVTSLLKARLDPHQVLGLRWMLKMEYDGNGVAAAKGRGVLVWEMGLGKTLMGICMAAADKVTKKGKPTLIVCQASVMGAWMSDFSRHCPASAVVEGGKRKKLGGPAVKVFDSKDDADTLERLDAVLCSYDMLRKEAIQQVEWSRVVLDEVQKFKSEDTKRSEGVSGLNFESAWALTGTPIKQRLQDWLGIAKALQLADVPWRGNVQMPMESEEERERWITDPTNVKTILDEYVMQMKAEDLTTALTEQGRERLMQPLRPSEEQRKWMKVCHDALNKARSEAKGPPGSTQRAAYIGKYQRPAEKSLLHPKELTAQWISDNKAVDLPSDIKDRPPDDYSLHDSCKFTAIHDFYISDEGSGGYFDDEGQWRPHGMIIFAENVEHLKCMKQFLHEAYGLDAFLLDGSIVKERRLKNIFEHFGLGANVDNKGAAELIKEGPRAGELKHPVNDEQWRGNIILGSTGACGEGVDFLKHVCTRVAWLQLPWTATDVLQAEARIFRRGQKMPVKVYVPYVVDIPDHKDDKDQPDPIDEGHGGTTLDQYHLHKIKQCLQNMADGVQDQDKLKNLDATELDAK